MEKLSKVIEKFKEENPDCENERYKNMLIGYVAEILRSYGFEDWDDSVEALNFLKK